MKEKSQWRPGYPKTNPKSFCFENLKPSDTMRDCLQWENMEGAELHGLKRTHFHKVVPFPMYLDSYQTVRYLLVRQIVSLTPFHTY